ncbi:MAG: response regulator transcription factor [Saprospiraceae bacterium]|nr:response regulator transcription factor [Saprospiraceae bacterium]
MNVFIVEDEPLGLDRLVKLLHETDESLRLLGTADSIQSAVQWLQTHPEPDLIFMDIELADGQCFEIFNRTEVRAPVVFTTSYDEYALNAFKVNSIDYLLKPIRKEDLQRALGKLRRLQTPTSTTVLVEQLLRDLNAGKPRTEYRQRFLVRQGQRMLAVETADIAYFFAEGKICWLRNKNNQRYLVDYTLDQLENLLDPTVFYRINRSYLVHVQAIVNIQPFLNGKLILTLEPTAENKDAVVSKEKATEFKSWMGK